MSGQFRFKSGIILGLCLFSLGCASLRSVSMTQIPKDRSHPIEAKVSNWAFLGIHFSNDFVDEAIQDLRDQCPNGRISGVYSKYGNYLYFLVTRRQVTVSAYCESSEGVQNEKKI